jgi:hypothetical protein
MKKTQSFGPCSMALNRSGKGLNYSAHIVWQKVQCLTYIITLAVTARATIYFKCWFHYDRIINLSSLYITITGTTHSIFCCFSRAMWLSAIPWDLQMSIMIILLMLYIRNWINPTASPDTAMRRIQNAVTLHLTWFWLSVFENNWIYWEKFYEQWNI